MRKVAATRTRTCHIYVEAQHGGLQCMEESTESQSSGGKPLYDIRLKGGSNFCEGFVEIKTIYDNYWGGICDDLSGLEEGNCFIWNFHGSKTWNLCVPFP